MPDILKNTRLQLKIAKKVQIKFNSGKNYMAILIINS